MLQAHRRLTLSRLTLALALAALPATALALTAGIQPAMAQGAGMVPGATAPTGWRTFSDVATHLAENGFEVVKLEMDDGGYEAELVDGKGNLLDAKVDPRTAELTRTRNDHDDTPDKRDPEWLTVAQLARHLESQGYLVRKIDTEHHGYEVEVTDKAGKTLDLKVDPKTGAVLRTEKD